MTWQPGVFTGLAAVAVLAFAVLHVAGRRSSTATGTVFAWFMLAGLLWAGTYGIQLGFTARAEQVLWQHATFVASSTVPPLLLLFVLRYAGEGDRLTPVRRALIAAEPISFALLVVTNPLHHLVWTDATFRPTSTVHALDVTFGVGYYGHVVVAYALVLLALALLLSVAFEGHTVYRQQAALLVLGVLPPFFAHIAYTLDLSPITGVDFTPFAFSVTGAFWGLALFHFDLLERTPVAQRRALDVVGDGLLVVDVDGLIVDADDVSRQVFGFEEEAESFAAATGYEHPIAADGASEAAVVDGTRRVYDVHASALDAQSGGAGYAVVLRDVSERNAYEERLEVANRVLRHNIRNDVNVIRGYADLLADDAETDERARMARVIDDTADDLASLSEKLRAAAIIPREETATATVDAVAAVETLLAEFREANPDVSFAFDHPDRAPVAGLTHQAFSLAVRNPLDNAVEHNDHTDLTVSVTIERPDEDRIRIRVRDDGSGLPAVERQVIESGDETPLQHSSGLGLWLTSWIADAAGGTVTVDADDGTVVTLELPAAEGGETDGP